MTETGMLSEIKCACVLGLLCLSWGAMYACEKLGIYGIGLFIPFLFGNAGFFIAAIVLGFRDILTPARSSLSRTVNALSLFVVCLISGITLGFSVFEPFYDL